MGAKGASPGEEISLGFFKFGQFAALSLRAALASGGADPGENARLALQSGSGKL